MRIAITGASGLVGSALVDLCRASGHEVFPAARMPAGRAPLVWDPEAGLLEPGRWEAYDAVVHLAGENIAARRWDARQKARIRASRVEGTRRLCEGLARLEKPPRVLACASAVGFYGNRGDELLDESSPPGRGFLAEVCQEWEGAAEPARQAGIRVVHLRFGIVLSARGGALARMLLPFRLGLGGPIGSGRQWMSWIALDDAAGAIVHVLNAEGVCGPVNLVSPRPVTNRDFARTLARVLRRPAWLFLPAPVARLALGEMADDMLLASTRTVPRVLVETGYRFAHAELEPALAHLLG